MWLVSGDKNTSFFHVKASKCFQRKTIVGLCDEASLWQTKDRVMECIMLLDNFKASLA